MVENVLEVGNGIKVGEFDEGISAFVGAIVKDVFYEVNKESGNGFFIC